MSSFHVNVDQQGLIWTERELKQQLNALAHLQDKQAGWITRDLTIKPSSSVTRLIWSLVIKHFECLRELFYNINLVKSQEILVQLEPQVKNRPALQVLFNEAVLKFEQVTQHTIPCKKLTLSEIRELNIKKEQFFNPLTNPVDHPVTYSLLTKEKPPLPIKTSSDETADLIHRFNSLWNPISKKFNTLPFNSKNFIALLEKYQERFKSSCDYKKAYGFIQKREVAPQTKIFVRADLHGDLKSLVENLNQLQKEGLLDENYRCLPEVQLVFLGDYADRGNHTMQVLEILFRLQLENPNQVTLIRGNHEYLDINQKYGNQDENFRRFLQLTSNCDLLEKCYEAMPLTLYIGQQNKNRQGIDQQQTGPQQYVQFTHGLFELHVDPQPLLLMTKVNELQVLKKQDFSERVSNLIKFSVDISKEEANKQIRAIKRIRKLWIRDSRENIEIRDGITTYNWGDMAQKSRVDSPGLRKWKLSVKDVKSYLTVSSSADRKVVMIFRGHQHMMQHGTYSENKEKALKIVVTTLSVGMDCPGYANLDNLKDQPDCAYVLTTAPKVKAWTKRAYLRLTGASDTKVTANEPLLVPTI